MSELLIAIGLFGILMTVWFGYRRLRPSQRPAHLAELDKFAERKSERTRELHKMLSGITEYSRVALILGFSLFIVGGISRNYSVGFLGWLVWGVGIFAPRMAAGLDGLLLDAAVSIPIISRRGERVVYGKDARGIAISNLIRGAFLLGMVLLASVLVLYAA